VIEHQDEGVKLPHLGEREHFTGDYMYQKTILDNGLRILTSNINYSQSVSMLISVGAGSRYEPPELAGLSHFLEHLPFKGTTKWPTARIISEAIEGVGGIMNASTDREMTVFWCKVAKPHYKQALAVLLDMILNPILDPQEMEKEREVIQEELRMTYDYPSQLVDLLIDDILWPDQAMGRDVGGSIDTVKSISLSDVRSYMEHQYNPHNTVISIAGDIEHAAVVEQINDDSHNWAYQETLDWERVSYNNPAPKVKIDNRATDQSHLCIGLPGLSLDDPDRFTLSIMNCILGDGMSSRLFQNLRETQGLVYDVSSSTSNYKDCGSLVIYCGTEPNKVQDSVRSIVSDLKNLLDPISNSEISKAKEYTKGRLLLRMEDTRSIASWAGTQELLTEHILDVDQVVSIIDKVNADDLKRVAEKIISEDNCKLAIVGPHPSADVFEQLLSF